MTVRVMVQPKMNHKIVPKPQNTSGSGSAPNAEGKFGEIQLTSQMLGKCKMPTKNHPSPLSGPRQRVTQIRSENARCTAPSTKPIFHAIFVSADAIT